MYLGKIAKEHGFLPKTPIKSIQEEGVDHENGR